MTTPLLLCTDLDRTLIPNGNEEESPNARPLFHKFAKRPEVRIAYVSGRHLNIILKAINQYNLPTPNFAIGDVGTTLYLSNNDDWQLDAGWQSEIAADWNGKQNQDLAKILSHLKSIEPQEQTKQNTYKLSYYAPTNTPVNQLLSNINNCLLSENIHANLVWSIDEEKNTGLLDILPKNASKSNAIRYLMHTHHFSDNNTIFAGDSGNDLDALTSGLQAILVRNAHPDVRQKAITITKSIGSENKLYQANGGFLDMNGNYAAGILEGIAHFKPEFKAWLESTHTNNLDNP